MIILTGPRKERSNADARIGIPMTAPEVRWFIDQLEAKNPNKNARKRMAELALDQPNITEDGKDVYREYLSLMK
ncbi:hypothetical protein [Rhizobium sp. Root651]|uniref:hypothetical protein n=1 Tax=Rhizobium sp. Root651 TaxID=1736577 RepID=UPI000713D986|nr:hypothetical protein [Rhizobium sp. Root651]KRA58190.1 hypothetical protein ASD85_17075 [Rhizobium sp. Root651]